MNTLNTADILRLIHPALAIILIFPILGIVIQRAWQTRQRRLQIAAEGKSGIANIVGKEHVQLGRWLSNSVVGISLIALLNILVKNILQTQLWQDNLFKVVFIFLMFVATISSLIALNYARPKHWRGIFATLTGAGMVILGSQDGVFRRSDEWFVSHYYYGIAVNLLMIFSLSIIPDIYQDRSQTWRKVHIILNCIALLFFIVQGLTGSRDLLEISLSWQENFLGKCDWGNKTCPQ
jgi:hypothetical protein